MPAHGVAGCREGIRGVCDAGYVHVPYVKQKLRRALWPIAAAECRPPLSALWLLRPQAFFVSPFENGSYGSVEQLGIPIIECADYMETSALGRAEWMKFYGMLAGKEREADSLFAVVEHEYSRLSAFGEDLPSQGEGDNGAQLWRRVVLSWRAEVPWGGSLLMPTGVMSSPPDGHSGSLSLAPETVISKAADADVWAVCLSRQPPVECCRTPAEYEGYRIMAAFKRGDIYECGSDVTSYFDEISFRPDWLLRDLVRIFHPQLKIPREQRYYKRLGS